MTDVWTTPRTFVAGEIETASIFNTHLRSNLNAQNGYKEKSADQSVTSTTTPTNDTHLVYTISGTGTYDIDVFGWGTSAANAAGHLALGWSFPTGTMHAFVHGLSTALASGNSGTAYAGALLAMTSATCPFAVGLSTTVTGFWMHARYVATATGTLQFMITQSVSNANASTLKAGSHMTVRQVL